MQTVVDLEDAGYILSVDGSGVRCVLPPGFTVDETLSYVLMDELRDRKAEVILYLRCRDELASLFGKVVDQLASAYPPGCIAWISENRPDLQKTIDLAESAADAAWLSCLEGAVDIDLVKAALVEWYKAYRVGILAYGEIVKTKKGAA